MPPTIEDELLEVLKTTTLKSDQQQRNIEIIAYWYGFRGSLWPTLEEAAEKFGLGSRERVRQIKEANSVRNFTPFSIPALQEFKNLIQRRPYWRQSELLDRLGETELVGDSFSIHGLFTLVNDLERSIGYEIYTPEIEAATRNSIDKYREYLVIADSEVANIASVRKNIRRLPGKYGVAKLSYLAAEYAAFESIADVAKDLIMASDESWSMEDGNDLWFTFEDRENVLINYSEKVFSIIDVCTENELARSYRNALGGRKDRRVPTRLSINRSD